MTWRPDLDGCIELAPAGQQHTIDSIAVTSPADAFGWLHPAYQHPFVLDESCWHSAKISDWPWPLRKALQSHHEPERFYRETLSRALGARFRQTPSLRQRLLALRYPVQIDEVPDGLIQEIAAALRKDSLAGLARGVFQRCFLWQAGNFRQQLLDAFSHGCRSPLVPIDQVCKLVALCVEVCNGHTQFSCDVSHRHKIGSMNSRFISVDACVRSSLIKANPDTELSLR